MEEISENIKTPTPSMENPRKKGKLYRAQLRLALAMVPLVTVAACVTPPPPDVVEYNKRVNEAMQGGDGPTSIVQGSESASSQSAAPGGSTNRFDEPSGMDIQHDKVGYLNEADIDADGDGYTDQRGHRIIGPDGQPINPGPPNPSVPAGNPVGTAPQAPQPDGTLHQGNEQGTQIEQTIPQADEMGPDSFVAEPIDEHGNVIGGNQTIDAGGNQITGELPDGSIDLSPYNQPDESTIDSSDQLAGSEAIGVPELRKNPDLATRSIRFINNGMMYGDGTATIITASPVVKGVGYIYDLDILTARHVADDVSEGVGNLISTQGLKVELGGGAPIIQIEGEPVYFADNPNNDTLLVRVRVSIPESRVGEIGQLGVENIGTEGVFDGETYHMRYFSFDHPNGTSDGGVAEITTDEGLHRINTDSFAPGSSGAVVLDENNNVVGMCLNGSKEVLGYSRNDCFARSFTRKDYDYLLSKLE